MPFHVHTFLTDHNYEENMNSRVILITTCIQRFIADFLILWGPAFHHMPGGDTGVFGKWYKPLIPYFVMHVVRSYLFAF